MIHCSHFPTSRNRQHNVLSGLLTGMAALKFRNCGSFDPEYSDVLINEEKICWACKRTLVEESKLGLCPDCVNKFGTPAAALGVLGFGVLVKQALKHRGKAVKGVANVIKHIK